MSKPGEKPKRQTIKQKMILHVTVFILKMEAQQEPSTSKTKLAA